jgi:hypothetical protein
LVCLGHFGDRLAGAFLGRTGAALVAWLEASKPIFSIGCAFTGFVYGTV